MQAPPERRLPIGPKGWFDPLGGELRIDGRYVRLRPRTAALLGHLLAHADRVVTKDELMQAVWPDVIVTEDSLVQCVKEIRKALGDGARGTIRTLPRVGYAFVALPPPATPARGVRVYWMAALVAALFFVGLLPAADSDQRPAAVRPMSLVVLPLSNRTGHASLDDAIDDLTEGITSALSRQSGAAVIAAGTAFAFKGRTRDVRRIGNELKVRYVLEGEAHLRNAELVLTVHLAQAADAIRLWSGEFAAGAGGAAPPTEEVAARVAASLGLQLIAADGKPAQRGAPGDLVARARAVLRWSGQGTQGIAQARALLEEALHQDESDAASWALLAWTMLDEHRFKPARAGELQRVEAAVRRALEGAPQRAESHGAQARLLYNQGRMAQALAAFDAALELDPNNPQWHAHRAAALIMLGQPETALGSLERAVYLSPRDPQRPLWQMFQGVALLHLGRGYEAVESLSRSVDGNPNSAFAHLFLASALGGAGRVDEAREHLRRLEELRPGLTLTLFRQREPSQVPEFLSQRERIYAGLRHAGMAE